MFGNVEKQFRVPIVSFCDIPISSAGENMSKYGSYALGLTEEWAVAKGLTKVIYLERNSPLAQNMLKSLDSVIAQNWTEFMTSGALLTPKDLKGDPLLQALDFLRYTKNYKGELKRSNGDHDPEYYFGDEQEWRYALNTGKFHQSIYIEEMAKHDGIVTLMQRLIEDEKLSFTSKDVRYILIAKEEERSEIEVHIQSLKEQFNESEMKGLISKIGTLDQIL
jgi:hypothetical protein